MLDIAVPTAYVVIATSRILWIPKFFFQVLQAAAREKMASLNPSPSPAALRRTLTPEGHTRKEGGCDLNHVTIMGFI